MSLDERHALCYRSSFGGCHVTVGSLIISSNGGPCCLCTISRNWKQCCLLHGGHANLGLVVSMRLALSLEGTLFFSRFVTFLFIFLVRVVAAQTQCDTLSKCVDGICAEHVVNRIVRG